MEKKIGNYYIGLYRDYSKDPFLHSQLAKGKGVGSRLDIALPHPSILDQIKGAASWRVWRVISGHSGGFECWRFGALGFHVRLVLKVWWARRTLLCFVLGCRHAWSLAYAGEVGAKVVLYCPWYSIPLSCEDLPGKVLRPQPALDILIAPHGSNAVDPLQLLHSPKSSSARVHNYMCIYTYPCKCILYLCTKMEDAGPWKPRSDIRCGHPTA